MPLDIPKHLQFAWLHMCSLSNFDKNPKYFNLNTGCHFVLLQGGYIGLIGIYTCIILKSEATLSFERYKTATKLGRIWVSGCQSPNPLLEKNYPGTGNIGILAWRSFLLLSASNKLKIKIGKLSEFNFRSVSLQSAACVIKINGLFFGINAYINELQHQLGLIEQGKKNQCNVFHFSSDAFLRWALRLAQWCNNTTKFVTVSHCVVPSPL